MLNHSVIKLHLCNYVSIYLNGTFAYDYTIFFYHRHSSAHGFVCCSGVLQNGLGKRDKDGTGAHTANNLLSLDSNQGGTQYPYHRYHNRHGHNCIVISITISISITVMMISNSSSILLQHTKFINIENQYHRFWGTMQ